jgi:hypothetical protein
MQKSSMSTLTGASALAVLGVAAISLLSIATPQAFAHQRELYTIGGQDFLIVIGSLNEPIFVDDKSGVDLRVLRADPSNPMNSSAAGASPMEGLEQTIQVEIAAGNKTKVLQLEPAFGEPGAYEAAFYPTVPTTFTYRLFGAINNTPVNLSFACTPVGEAGATANNSTVQVSEGVVRKGVEGGFGCPAPISDAGFPEPYMSNFDITTKLNQLQRETSPTNLSSTGSTAATAS